MRPPTGQATETTKLEAEKPLPTIWNAPDLLWELIEKVLAVYDPPNNMGRKRCDARKSFDGIIFRLRTGCQWNQLPQEFGFTLNVCALPENAKCARLFTPAR